MQRGSMSSFGKRFKQRLGKALRFAHSVNKAVGGRSLGVKVQRTPRRDNIYMITDGAARYPWIHVQTEAVGSMEVM